MMTSNVDIAPAGAGSLARSADGHLGYRDMPDLVGHDLAADRGPGPADPGIRYGPDT